MCLKNCLLCTSLAKSTKRCTLSLTLQMHHTCPVSKDVVNREFFSVAHVGMKRWRSSLLDNFVSCQISYQVNFSGRERSSYFTDIIGLILLSWPLSWRSALDASLYLSSEIRGTWTGSTVHGIRFSREFFVCVSRLFSCTCAYQLYNNIL